MIDFKSIVLGKKYFVMENPRIFSSGWVTKDHLLLQFFFQKISPRDHKSNNTF